MTLYIQSHESNRRNSTNLEEMSRCLKKILEKLDFFYDFHKIR